jgi:DNA-binding MarR family transcriptional regulator
MSSPETPQFTESESRIWRTYLFGSASVAYVLYEDLRHHGLNMGDYKILVALSESPDSKLRMSELAKYVYQSRSCLTHAVDRLERRGFVRRLGDENDRRGKIAQLTDQGRQMLDDAMPSHVKTVYRSFIDTIGADDFAVVGRAMQKVLAVNHAITTAKGRALTEMPESALAVD